MVARNWIVSLLPAAFLCLLGGSIAMAKPAAPASQVVVANTTEHPRNGEGDIIPLKNGDLLLAYGRWTQNGDDFGPAEIWSKTSHDGGRTWGEDRVLVPNEGKVTTFEVGFLRLRSGPILMCYCVKDSTEDCSVCFRKSTDEGRTWGDRVKYRIPEPYTGYTAINNNRLIQLKSGRILLAAYDGWVKGRIILSFTLYSDDDGKTWQKSHDVDVRDLDPNNKYGADEPAVIELKSGRVMMLARTDLGVIIRAISRDGGATWSRPEAVPGIVSPNSPASVGRLPQTGDLLLVWNNNPATRNPLNTAVSKDEGQTWENVRALDAGAASFCYTSITPLRDRVLLTYYGRGGLVLRSVPVRWFYEKQTLGQSWMFEGSVEELPAGGGWHLTKRGCLFIQGMPAMWNGALDSEVEATIILRSTTDGKQATAMLWVGDAAPNASCALYLRAGPAADAVSFSPTMEGAAALPDAGKPHRYRIVTHHGTGSAELFVDDRKQPLLTTPLRPVLGEYNINRILYGDPNVDPLGGDSDLLSIRWKNGI